MSFSSGTGALWGALGNGITATRAMTAVRAEPRPPGPTENGLKEPVARERGRVKRWAHTPTGLGGSWESTGIDSGHPTWPR